MRKKLLFIPVLAVGVLGVGDMNGEKHHAGQQRREPGVSALKKTQTNHEPAPINSGAMVRAALPEPERKPARSRLM